MNTCLRHALAVAVLATVGTHTLAQPQPYVIPMAATASPMVVAVSQQELDAILAPIALYPDSLLANILMAATYPADVTDAARWSRAIPGVPADEAVRSVANRGWDYSVQSLMAFPQVLDMMDRAPDWTRRLGDAFLTQQPQVWATVQALRQRAYTMGQLRSSEQLRVLFNGALIVLEPARPDVVYVPYYDPLRVYGTWWWPSYAPMRWDPWPGYVVRPARGIHYYTGPSVSIGLNFFFGNIDWYTQRIVVAPTPRWVDRHHDERRWQPGRPWEHDERHRRDNDKHRSDAPPSRFVAPAVPVNPTAPRVTPQGQPQYQPQYQVPQQRDGGKEWRTDTPSNRSSSGRGSDHDRNTRGGNAAPASAAPLTPTPENGANVPSATSRMLHQPPKVQNAPATRPETVPAPRKSEPSAAQPQPDHLGTKPINVQEQERRVNPKEGGRTY